MPKLRFPEFRNAGEWATEPLGSLVSINTEKVGDKTCVPMSITSGVGLVSQEDKFGRVIAGDSYKNYLLLKPFDFAYNKSATKEFPEGFLTLYTGDKLAAVPNSIFTCFRITGASAHPQYLNYLFSGNLHGQWLRKFIQVGARAHGSLSINDSDLLALPVPVPVGQSSLVEQQKIADCLSSLDELIAAQARKVDSLKTHKKGLMQQLFPREGETQPRLRFPEFRDAGEWVICELGRVSDVRDGTHDSPVFFTSGRPLVTSKNLRSDGALDLENVSLISEEDFEQINKRSKVSVGDILFGMIGTIGNPVLIKSEGFAIKNVALIKQLGPLLNSFLVQLLQSDYVAEIFAVLNTGNSQKFIALGKIRCLPVPVPSLQEQNGIADCLTSLDTLITAATKELETLKKRKKGLMQQLFPSTVEAV